MSAWRLYFVAMVALAVPVGGLWIQLWQVCATLKWLEPEPDVLALATLSIGVSGALALLVTRARSKAYRGATSLRLGR